MNSYEHTIIIKQELGSDKVKSLIKKYEDIITNNSGEILKAEDWGLMNLTYEIKKNNKGRYYHFKFKGDGKIINLLETKERIDGDLLRFLTVKVKKLDLETNYFEDKFEKKRN